MKYYIGRKSKYTGRVEYQRCKCVERFCDEWYIRQHPENVWQFSKQGAANIVARENKRCWNFEWFMVPVDEILKGVMG